MNAPHWYKQTKDQPLYPDLLWSQPENRQLAGKLLIIGGNAYEFAAPADAYRDAVAAGIGTTRVLLPDALKKTVGRILDVGEFAPSTPSGSFSQKALDEFLVHSGWADSVLLAGDFGRNSETAILLEKYSNFYNGQLVFTKDAADYAIASPAPLLQRPNTCLVISLAQLQKLAKLAHNTRAITFGMDMIRLVEALHEFTSRFGTALIVKQLDTILVAYNGNVSTTKLLRPKEIWRVQTAAYASVWWLQNPVKSFSALTTAVYMVTAG